MRKCWGTLNWRYSMLEYCCVWLDRVWFLGPEVFRGSNASFRLREKRHAAAVHVHWYKDQVISNNCTHSHCNTLYIALIRTNKCLPALSHWSLYSKDRSSLPGHGHKCQVHMLLPPFALTVEGKAMSKSGQWLGLLHVQSTAPAITRMLQVITP